MPYDYAPAERRTGLQTNGLQMVLFDAPMGDWSKGDRGMHGYFLHRTEQARRIIDELGYRGWIGCEYRPLGNTSDGLGWAARYGIAASPPVGA